MTTKLPGYHLLAGLGFFVFGMAIKDHFPALGLSPYIQFPSAFFSAVLFPIGTFLALHALIVQGEQRRKLLSQFLAGLGFLFFMLTRYFYTYLVIMMMLNLPTPLPSILPKLVESARTLPTEGKRAEQAEWAYKMYGVTIAYRLDNNQVIYYSPSEQDKAYRRDQGQTDARNSAMTAFVKKFNGELPYLFTLYLSTYFCTFLAGGIWLVMKIPKDSVPP